jgi:hypothetical protein
MISHFADVPFFRDELATLHAVEWKHFYADWDEQSALAEFLNQKADGSLPATLVLHEGMELVGSVSVVFGDCPAEWIRMIFHHRLWCSPNRQVDRWEKLVIASDLKQQIS